MSKLEKAVSEMNIPENEPFHTALNDARYTALVMKEMKAKNINQLYSFNIYITPKNKEEEIEVSHNNQYEYISRGFRNKHAALDDEKVTQIRCYKCSKKVKTHLTGLQIVHHDLHVCWKMLDAWLFLWQDKIQICKQ